MDLLLDPTACDAGLEIKRATGKRGADVCIEYSGSHLALQAALRGVAYLGTVVAGAWPGSYPAGLDFGAEAHMNRPRIVFVAACSEPNPDHPNWDEQRIFEAAGGYCAMGRSSANPSSSRSWRSPICCWNTRRSPRTRTRTSSWVCDSDEKDMATVGARHSHRRPW